MVSVKTREIVAKSILTKSRIYGVDYVINPYLGCSHSCGYCYADFMKKYRKRREDWGTFVDAKVNAPEIVRKELTKMKKAKIMISSVCDPYQPAEKQYELTRKILETLLAVDKNKNLEISILTKSPLVLRDIDLLKKFKKIEIGITITTDDDEIRHFFEPNAPSIALRIDALKKLKEQGLCTYAFIGPILPMSTEKLAAMLSGIIEFAFIDKMNYLYKTEDLYRKNNMEYAMSDEFFEEKKKELAKRFGEIKIPTKILF